MRVDHGYAGGLLVTAMVAAALLTCTPPVGAAPTCMPGDEKRQGYQCERGPASPAPVDHAESPAQCAQQPIEFPWRRDPLTQRVPERYETVCRR